MANIFIITNYFSCKKSWIFEQAFNILFVGRYKLLIFVIILFPKTFSANFCSS